MLTKDTLDKLQVEVRVYLEAEKIIKKFPLVLVFAKLRGLEVELEEVVTAVGGGGDGYFFKGFVFVQQGSHLV